MNLKQLLTILLFTGLLFGQEQSIPGWGFYGGMGMNNVKMSGSDADDLTPKALTGTLMGVSKGVVLGGIPLFTGAGLGQRGFKAEETVTESIMGLEVSSDVKGETSLNYLDVWMVMPYPFGLGLAWAGPSVGMFLNGKSKVDMKMEMNGVEIANESLDEDIESGPGDDKADYGIIIGYSYPLPIMDGKLSLNGGYYLGLMDHDDITFNSVFAHISYRL